jgi:hypothetical protein
MGPRNAYKDMLDNVVSPITCVSMNHQNQLEQMANGAMFATQPINRSLHPVGLVGLKNANQSHPLRMCVTDACAHRTKPLCYPSQIKFLLLSSIIIVVI